MSDMFFGSHTIHQGYGERKSQKKGTLHHCEIAKKYTKLYEVIALCYAVIFNLCRNLVTVECVFFPYVIQTNSNTKAVNTASL